MKLPTTKTAPAPEEKQKPADANRQVDGFLVPDQYRRQSIYRNHPIFKATLLVLLLTFILGGLGGYQWFLATNLQKAREGTQQLLIAETDRLQNQTVLLQTTKTKYRELDILRRQLRIPITPILDAVEKTIPTEISINGLEIKCLPQATDNNSKRRAEVTMIVFFPEGIKPTDEKLTNWPNKINDQLLLKGLKGLDAHWGAQEELILPKTKNRKESHAWTRQLTYSVELEPAES